MPPAGARFNQPMQSIQSVPMPILGGTAREGILKQMNSACWVLSYRVAQSWAEVWIGPSVESGSAMGWADVTRSRRRPGTCCRSCAELVRTPSLPTKRQSHLPKHLGRLGRLDRLGRLGRPGRDAQQPAGRGKSAVGSASVRRRHVGAD